jgi:hypothetical protein
MDMIKFIKFHFSPKKNAPREGASYGEEQKRNLGAHFIIRQIKCQKM